MDAHLLPFNCFFLGLDAAGVIRFSAGSCPAIAEPLPESITWKEFAARYADEANRPGLEAGWSAVAERRVAPRYWPEVLPFRGAVAARLRPVNDQPTYAYVVQLVERPEPALDALINKQMLPLMDRLVRIGQHVSSGVDGPLTDKQVRDIQSMLREAEQVRSLLEQIHAAQLAAFVASPLPIDLHALLSFSESDFAERRITTHRLKIRSELSTTMVYGSAQLRDVVRRILLALVNGISAQSQISLSDRADEDGQAQQIEIRFHSQDAEFLVPQRFDAQTPLIGVSRHIAALVTLAHAYLTPVHGRAWIEPCTEPGSTARLVLLIPRWQNL